MTRRVCCSPRLRQSARFCSCSAVRSRAARRSAYWAFWPDSPGAAGTRRFFCARLRPFPAKRPSFPRRRWPHRRKPATDAPSPPGWRWTAKAAQPFFTLTRPTVRFCPEAACPARRSSPRRRKSMRAAMTMICPAACSSRQAAAGRCIQNRGRPLSGLPRPCWQNGSARQSGPRFRPTRRALSRRFCWAIKQGSATRTRTTLPSRAFTTPSPCPACIFRSCSA